jgi:hypothetical protein
VGVFFFHRPLVTPYFFLFFHFFFTVVACISGGNSSPVLFKTMRVAVLALLVLVAGAMVSAQSFVGLLRAPPLK